MSIAFVHRGWMLLVTTPSAVLLLVCIGMGGCGWPISFEKLALGYRLAPVDVERAEFGFGRQRHHSFDELGNVEYSVIVRGVLCVG